MTSAESEMEAASVECISICLLCRQRGKSSRCEVGLLINKSQLLIMPRCALQKPQPMPELKILTEKC